MSSSYRSSLEYWLKELDVRAERCLDIGGSQLPARGRTKSWDVKEYLIADLEKPHADSKQPEVFMDINWPMTEELVDQMFKFDLVFCLEVFEYIWNPALAVRNIANCMSDNGSAWVTFPSFYPLHNPIEDDALRYMPGGIRKLAEFADLTIEEMIPRRPETSALQNAWSAERMRAAKGQDHAFTGWIVKLRKK